MTLQRSSCREGEIGGLDLWMRNAGRFAEMDVTARGQRGVVAVALPDMFICS